MKKTWTPLTMLVLLFSLIIWLKGCGDKTTPGNEAFQSKSASPQEVLSDPISIQETGHLMTSLFQHDSLRKLAHNGMYGVFGGPVFDLTDCVGPECGVLLWYCYNPKQKHKLPRFFVAVERLTRFDSTKEHFQPFAEMLYVPFTTFSYVGGFQHNDVVNWLKNHKTPTTSQVRQISKADVIELVEEFRKFNETVTHQGTSFVHFPYAFFRNNQAYRNFMSRKPAYVRYYFGVHWIDSLKPNYLRPVLGGANDQGQTIEKFVDPDDQPFLQKSIPPPPTQE